MKNKKGFTLVELLAVIVILSVIIVIAVPKIMGTVTNSKKASLETATLSIISGAEKLYLENQLLGIKQDIKCSDVAKMQSNVYGTCDIKFDDEGNATVILNGKKDGKFDNLACSGTKEGVTCKEGSIELDKGLQCIFDGVLVPGAEFVHNQYTYRYKEEYVADFDGNSGWEDLSIDGWHVRLTDKTSTDPVNTPICSTINDKPIVSTTLMFAEYDSNGNQLLTQTTEIDVSEWDTSNVTNMMGMFALTQMTTQIKGLDKLETGNVINMSGLFMYSGASTLDLSNFDTSNVTDMMGMFAFSNATEIKGLSELELSEVTNMTMMFYDSKASVIDLQKKDLSKVTDMSFMFARSDAKEVNLSYVDAKNVTDISNMFVDSVDNITSYEELLDVVSTIEVINMKGINLSSVTDMSSMFTICRGDSIDLSYAVLTDLENIGNMFQGCELNKLNLSNIDARNVKNIQGIFYHIDGVTTTINNIDMSNMNLSGVEDMSNMFQASAATVLNLSGMNVSGAKNMYQMFYFSKATTLDLSSFDTSNVTNMSYMFGGSAVTSLDLSSFDTSKVTNMNNMFYSSPATVGYARTQGDADKFNASSNKPSKLTFTVKTS